MVAKGAIILGAVDLGDRRTVARTAQCPEPPRRFPMDVEVAKVEVALDRERSLTLLFDPEHALDERIAMEQFAT